MKPLLRILGTIVLVLIVLIAGTLIGARFADGPLEIIAGGPFKTGMPYTGAEPDWSFVKDLETVELQTMDPARSRTTWIVYHDGRAYIPCGYMNTAWGRIWKQWPIEVARDGRAIVRIDGTLYDRYLVRIEDAETIGSVALELGRKYLGLSAADMASEPEGLWIFELAPRS